MILYILRHGKAARQDPDKPLSLTPEGRDEVNRVAECFKKKNLKITDLWHSHKTRAIQSAEIVLKVLADPSIKVEEKKELKPEGDVQRILDQIEAHEDGPLMLVSHLPFVGELASLLATDSPKANLVFPTAGLVAFERKNKTWKWLWSMNPLSLE